MEGLGEGRMRRDEHMRGMGSCNQAAWEWQRDKGACWGQAAGGER